MFVKLTGDAIPIQMLNFYALSLAAAFLALAIPRVPRATSPVCAMRDGDGAAASQVNASLLPAIAPAGDTHASARQVKRHTGATCVNW